MLAQGRGGGGKAPALGDLCCVFSESVFKGSVVDVG